jgi:hypothetical protein
MRDDDTLVKTFERADGKARLFIVRRKDGLFRFEGEREVKEPIYGDYWTPCDLSGLFQTAEETEREARISIPWLREQISN